MFSSIPSPRSLQGLPQFAVSACHAHGLCRFSQRFTSTSSCILAPYLIPGPFSCAASHRKTYIMSRVKALPSPLLLSADSTLLIAAATVVIMLSSLCEWKVYHLGPGVSKTDLVSLRTMTTFGCYWRLSDASRLLFSFNTGCPPLPGLRLDRQRIHEHCKFKRHTQVHGQTNYYIKIGVIQTSERGIFDQQSPSNFQPSLRAGPWAARFIMLNCC